MRECKLSTYCYGEHGTRFLIAAPKTALLQGHALRACPGRKRFGIRAVYDKTGKVRRPRTANGKARITQALRKGAARALAAACAYHQEIEVEPEDKEIAVEPEDDEIAVEPEDERSAGFGAGGGESTATSDSAGSQLESQPSNGGDDDKLGAGGGESASTSDSAGSQPSNGGDDDKSGVGA